MVLQMIPRLSLAMLISSYLGGEEGPAVGGGACAACAVAAVRHRPRQA